MRARADTGDEDTLKLLAKLLIKQGRVEEMIDLLLPHPGFGAEVLVRLLAKHGRVEEADRLYRFGLTVDGRIASNPTGT